MTLNEQVSRRLDEAADLLAEQGANIFRVQAYRRAADTVRRLPGHVSEILERERLEGLERLPGVGDRLAVAIRDLVETGQLPLLRRLRGETDAIELLQSVPGVGRVNADRLHHDLGIDSLEDLEAAAHDGRLAEVSGFGKKRIAGIVDSLAARLGRVRAPGHPGEVHPPVEELLDVDRVYREQAALGKLPKMAPRRFNPAAEAWLPILHTQRGECYYTALFSNTARAHRLGKTRDWVILYYDGRSERQSTVVTAQHGELAGLRIVRGREAECARYYGLDEVELRRARAAPVGLQPE
jgi:DNA polymerase (family X)